MMLLAERGGKKIEGRHRDRLAVVYVRQSWPPRKYMGWNRNWADAALPTYTTAPGLMSGIVIKPS